MLKINVMSNLQIDELLILQTKILKTNKKREDEKSILSLFCQLIGWTSA